MENDVPVAPYFIQSGPKRSMSLEMLMLKDYSWLMTIKARMDAGLTSASKPNAFHRHLLWLVERGEDRVAKKLCPNCKKGIVRSFSHHYDGNRDHFRASCGELRCRLLYAHPLKFSSILKFREPARPSIARFFKEVFLPDCLILDDETLFRFFAEKSPAL